MQPAQRGKGNMQKEKQRASERRGGQEEQCEEGKRQVSARTAEGSTTHRNDGVIEQSAEHSNAFAISTLSTRDRTSTTAQMRSTSDFFFGCESRQRWPQLFFPRQNSFAHYCPVAVLIALSAHRFEKESGRRLAWEGVPQRQAQEQKRRKGKKEENKKRKKKSPRREQRC
jgi:hypothetical protein